MKSFLPAVFTLLACAATSIADPSGPAPDMPAEWIAPFRGEVLEAAVANQFAYYLLHATNAFRDAPGRVGALDAINPSGEGNDNRLAVVCVKLDDGKITWSRLVNGYGHLAADPRNDNIHIYGKVCFTLAAKDGGILRQFQSPDKIPPDGIIIASQVISADPPDPRNRSGNWRLIDPDTGNVLELDVPRNRLMSPDEKYRLSAPRAESRYSLTCTSVADDSNAWVNRIDNIGAPILSTIPPVWSNGKVFWMVGAYYRKTQIFCLAGDTGQILWQHTLPDGCYDSTSHPLISHSNSRPVDPFTVSEQFVTALDNAGRIHFFDTATGQPRGRFHATRDYLCPPVIRNNRLIVCSFTSIRSYRLSILASDAPVPTLQTAKQLLQTGHPDQALELASLAISENLDFAPAYQLAADALDQLKRPDDAIFFRTQALCAGGGGSDPALASQIGLHKIIALGSPASPVLMPYQNELLVGTLDGRLMAINPFTLAVRQLAETPDEIGDLYLTASAIQTRDNASRHNTHPLSLPPRLNEPEPHDDEFWNLYNSYDGTIVYHHGSFFRPTGKGVLQYDPVENHTVLHPLPLKHENKDSDKRWFIHLNESEPHYGYGVGGISILNDQLCPEKWLVHLPEGSASDMRTSSDDICALVSEHNHPRQLRIYSRTGELIRAADSAGLNSWPNSNQLIRLNGGYLLCGMDAVYLHPDANIPVIRIARPTDKALRSIDPAWRDGFDFFGPAAIANDRILTVSRDGCIYVFDAAFFGRPNPQH